MSNSPLQANQNLNIQHPGKNSWALYKYLFHNYLKPHWRKLILAQIAIIIVALSTFLQVRLLEPIFDFILVDGNERLLYTLPFFFLMLSFCRGCAVYLQNRQIALVGHKVIQEIQSQLYACLLKGDIAPILSDRSGHLISRFSFDMQLVRNVVAQSMIGAVRDIILLIVYITNLFYTNWQLAILVGFIFPMAIFPILYVGRKLRVISYHLQEKTGDTSAFLGESFQGISQIKAYGSEDFMLKRANNIFTGLFKINFRQEDIRARVHPVIETLFGLAMAITIMVSGYQVIAGETTVGAFMSFFTALMLAYQPVRGLSAVNSRLQEGLAAADRLFALMGRQPKIVNIQNAKPLKLKQSNIKLENVSFTYDSNINPSTPALHNISMDIRGGEKIAIVGTSGAGKSTLFHLLLRFYDVSSGKITIDDQDIRRITMASLRHNISVVSQEQGIFNSSIADNVTFGCGKIDWEKLQYATKMADAEKFIDNLPEKYATMAGENGNRLSGGQRQRLAIARAFYKDAPILILDEATSALDQKTEKNIQKSLSVLMKNRTVLIIAHRLSTVQNAHRIYVFDHGKILEYGKHDELLAQGGLYALLYKKGDELT